MKKTSALLFVLQFFIFLSYAQKITVRVIDETSKKGVFDANIRINNEINFKRTNALGYSQFNAVAGDTLIISHHSFKISEVLVPETSGFSINLSRYYYDLDSININLSAKQLANIGSVLDERFVSMKGTAYYKGGWSTFINNLANNITDWQNLKGLDNSDGVGIKFTVSKDGIVSDVKLDTEEKGLTDNITAALTKLNNWKPASFRDIFYDQYFTIKIYKDDGNLNSEAIPENGYDAFYAFISQNLKYPSEAKKLSIKGKVYIEFTVSESGKLTNINVVKGIGGGCDEEALRVFSLIEKWKPAIKNGKPTIQKITMPITFN